MKSDIDDLLNMVDKWKFKLHTKLKKMTSVERRAFWSKIHQDARKSGLNVAEPERAVKRPMKRVRRTG
jgi:hypothetical protein